MRIFYFLCCLLLLMSCNKMNNKRRSTQYQPEHFFSETELPIGRAIIDGDNSKLKHLIKQGGVNISQPGKMGYTYLLYAMEFENYEAMEILLSSGSDPNVASSRMYVPGAGIQKKPSMNTCIGTCAYSQYGMKYLKLLIKYGVNINDNQNILVLEKAIGYHRDEMIDFLLKNGAELNVISTFGTTPIITATQGAQWDLVERLLDLGADPFLEVQLGTDGSRSSSVKGWVEYNLSVTEGTRESNKKLAKLLKRLEGMGMTFDYSQSRRKFEK